MIASGTKLKTGDRDWQVRLDDEMIPKEFFVTSGQAISPVSELNAFDLALKNAGVEQCNIVLVSSILPPKCREVEPKSVPSGAITYAVMARMDGGEKTSIGAGIAWTWETAGKYGLVAEAHGHLDQESLEETLTWKIKEMAKIRGIQIQKVNCRKEVLTVPANNYGCVIALLVYLP